MSAGVFRPLSLTAITPAGMPRDQLLGDVEIHRERPQVAVVDADDRRAGVERHGQLLVVVHLDERIEAERRLRAPAAA